MFVDASAIIAIMDCERDADRLADALGRASARVTSPVAIFEAVLGLRRKHRASMDVANAAVGEFLALAQIDIVPVTVAESRAALDAFARFGKGTGYPAQLNMGDCFAYAVARIRSVPLLYKGNDFSRTDIESGA